ncbi:MAG: TnpV protein [Candidatus Howiella sp.]
MEKSLFEQMGGTYRQVGDYLIPNLELPPQDNRPIGIWGQRHLRYIKQNKKSLYIELKMSGKLNDHLADVNEEAEEMFSRLVKQMAEKQGVTEQLKAENQMNWVGRMNCIRNQATEIINNELIYA